MSKNVAPPLAVLKVDITIEVDWGDIGAGAIAVLKIEIVAPSGGILKIDSLGDLLNWSLTNVPRGASWLLMKGTLQCSK